MKKHIGFLMLIVLLFAFTGCGTAQPAQTSEQAADSGSAAPAVLSTTLQDIKDRGYLNVAVKTDVPGFGYQKEDGSFDGLEVDLGYQLAAALFDTDIETVKTDELIQFIGVTYDQRGTVLDDGTADFTIATFTITPERAEQWTFTSPYYTDAIGLMVKKTVTDANSLGTNAITSISNLDGKIIGIARDTTTRNDLLNYLDRNNLDITPQFMEFSNYNALKKALDADTIDVFAVDRSILQGYVDNNTTILPDKFAYQNYGIASCKSCTELSDFAQNTLDTLTENGTLSELIRNQEFSS